MMSSQISHPPSNPAKVTRRAYVMLLSPPITSTAEEAAEAPSLRFMAEARLYAQRVCRWRRRLRLPAQLALMSPAMVRPVRPPTAPPNAAFPPCLLPPSSSSLLLGRPALPRPPSCPKRPCLSHLGPGWLCSVAGYMLGERDRKVTRTRHVQVLKVVECWQEASAGTRVHGRSRA